MINKEDSNIIQKLVVYDISQDLPSQIVTTYDYDISELEIEHLCKLSSILALSDDSEKQALAYEIVTKLFKNFHDKYPNLYSIAHAILSRLGNFPNRQLLDKYGFSKTNLEQSPAIKLEIIARQSENKIVLNNNNTLLTDFQKRFFNVLTKKSFYSVSAPTSAGKSFIFTLSIIERLLHNIEEKIVLIVPTRALIQELSNKIIQSLKEYQLINKVNVRTVPILEEETINKGMVYVLTQERLTTLLNEEKVHLDTVFIDEAQEIQGNRGVVLQNTLELLLERFLDINLFFASPLIENPNYFNELLELDYNTNSFIEDVSPVGQNIIFLSEIKGRGKTKQIKLELFNREKNIDLGYLKVDFEFRKDGKIIDLAKSITQDNELTLIYCNGASEAESKALKMSKILKEEIIDDDIKALIQFIKEDVHKDYSLIECLKKGVAYHYSYIPATVRTEIEQLASNGKLKYIFCTSTLLQGVNLPTKNIILSNPSKGRGKPMQRSDFLNLIGRAGRLQHEFQGNIWCIEPYSWDEKSYEGDKLQKIESFYTKTLAKDSEDILELAKDENNKKNNNYLSVFGKFYADFIINGKSLDKYQQYESFQILNDIYKECEEYNLELPDNIIEKHYSIHPKNLNKLYIFFKNENDLNLWIPINVFKRKKDYPYEDGTYERLLKIFKKINEIILNKYDYSYKYITSYASKWIHDESLNKIILDNYKYNLKKEPKRRINKSIIDTLETIEGKIRFEYVLYTSAYLDILKYLMEEKGLYDDIENIPNLPLHLECGSANLLVINLMSLGLSRLTCLNLKKLKVFSCDEPTAINCFNALKKIDINSLSIPIICQQEIRSLID